MTQAQHSSRTGLTFTLLLSALYWLWESRASGNIRVDLLLIYPLLFLSYTIALWPRFRFRALLIAAALMFINVVYAVASYSWFAKNPG